MNELSALSKRLLAALFIVIVLAFVGTTIAIYNRAFTASDTVTLNTDQLAYALPNDADVKARGVLVGRVSGVEPDGDRVRVNMEFDPAYMDQLPANVSGRLLPKTLFGEKYVALVVPEGDLAEELRAKQNALGAVASPFDSWLAQRGVRTLAVRMAAHCAGAQRVAEALAEHPDVIEVLYPGLTSHPGHDVAARQMTGFGGMLSFRAAGGPRVARRVAESTRIFTLAESLGGVESLIEVPAAMTHQSSSASRRPVPEDLIRVSVGIEDPGDLIDDLLGALEQARS